MSVDYNVQTTTQNTPGASITAEMKAFYDKALIRYAKPKLVHSQFGQARNIPANSGKTIEFRRFSPLPKALKPLTEGVTPSGNSLNVTSVSATVEQYGDYITTSDLLNLTAVDDIIAETQNVLGDQAGRTLDTIVREKINAGTNVLYGNGKASRGALVGGEDDYADNDYLNVATVKKAVSILKRNNAAPFKDGHFVAIVHPDVANDLTSDPEWINIKSNTDPKDWYEGAIGCIHGVVFIESTEAKIFTSDPLESETGDGNLTVVEVDGNKIIIAEALTSAQASALANKKININGATLTIASATAGDAGEAYITVSSNDSVPESAQADTIIYPGGGSANGRDVYSTLFIGQNAYGVTSLEKGGLESIIKQKGSAGTSDPLDQRSTIGWKATQTAEILSNEFMVRVETTSSYR